MTVDGAIQPPPQNASAPDPDQAPSGASPEGPAASPASSALLAQGVAASAGNAPVGSSEDAPASGGPETAGLQRATVAIGGQGRDLPPGLTKRLEDQGGADKTERKAEGTGTDPSSPKPDALSTKAFETFEKALDTPASPALSLAQHAASKVEGQPGQAPQQANANAPQTPVLQQVPLGSVPIEIGLKSLAGVNRFEIRLDPAELGRIDVRLDIGEAGEVKAHLVVDRVETLALLQRDAKTLERAFEQAGLKPSDGGIDLSLRDPSGDRRGGDPSRDERGQRSPVAMNEGTPSETREAPVAPRRMLWRSAGGVDLRI